jgi:type I restriction enzyme S subunit
MIDRLKPYVAYKDHGVPWLGQMPVHWKVRRLKSATILIIGQPPLG